MDGAQSFGVMKVNLREIGCDSYSGSAHKWMMGPLESGVLYVRADRIGRVWPAIVTAGWSEDLKGARKLEVLGQRDDPRILAFEAAVDFYNMLGPDRIEARTRELVALVKTNLVNIPNVRMKTNLEPALSLGVVKFQLTNRDTKESYDKLWKGHRLSLAMTPSGDSEGIRISPHVYNTAADMERAAAAVREIARG